MELHAIGIDLGKTLFHLVGVDSSGAADVNAGGPKRLGYSVLRRSGYYFLVQSRIFCESTPKSIRQFGSVSCTVLIPRSSFFERNKLAKQKPMNR